MKINKEKLLKIKKYIKNNFKENPKKIIIDFDGNYLLGYINSFNDKKFFKNKINIESIKNDIIS